MIRCYSDLMRLNSFNDRFLYLQMNGSVGRDTFGFDRYINQRFYQSREWKRIRDQVILRDNGCDLGVEGYEIHERIYIHHMNPLLLEDIKTSSEFLLNPEYLITTTHATHNAIHYGDDGLLSRLTPVERTRNDTCPWRNGKEG